MAIPTTIDEKEFAASVKFWSVLRPARFVNRGIRSIGNRDDRLNVHGHFQLSEKLLPQNRISTQWSNT